MMEKPYAVTHNGKFHADDVFSAAMLKKLFPELVVVRSRDQAVIADAVLVFDVGGVYDHESRRYDHHQNGALKRDNGLTRSAFGLLWLHYGEAYCDGDKRVADRIDQELVIGIDARDNGEVDDDSLAPDYGISPIIEQLNPLVDSDETYDEQFAVAVGRAAEILERLYTLKKVEVAVYDEIASMAENADDPRFVVLDRQITPPSNLPEITALEFVVFPENINNTWQVLAINQPDQAFVCKHPFPEAWAGLRDQTLAEATGVADAVFCHKKRFLAVAKSREGALALLDQALGDDRSKS